MTTLEDLDGIVAELVGIEAVLAEAHKRLQNVLSTVSVLGAREAAIRDVTEGESK